MTTGLVLVNRPDKAIGVAEGEFAPAPGLVRRLARYVQERLLFHAMLIECVDIIDLDLEMKADAQPGVEEFFGMGFLGVNHEGEGAQAKDGEAVRCSLVFGVKAEQTPLEEIAEPLSAVDNLRTTT